MKMPKWVHIIGICGSATSAVAIMFKNAGVKVTGSDKGFFPPVSDYLNSFGIEIGVGYKKNRLHDNGQTPDLVVVQGTKPDNEEYEEALKLGIEIKTFPEVLEKFLIKEDSIVVSGTYGKTSISAMLVKMFYVANKPVNYMFGGVPADFTPSALYADDANFSIVEGDEYITSLDDNKSKFFHYKPKYMILNSCKHEHTDVFKTEEDYVDNFKKIVSQIPSSGILVANANDENVVEISNSAKCKKIYYSYDRTTAKTHPDWFLDKTTKPLPTFIKWDKKSSDIEVIPFQTDLIGDFNIENFLAASVMAYELQIKKERIQDAIEEFRGIKRRLEIVFKGKKSIIIDDFGSSPPKAKGSLDSIKKKYPDSRIIVIFEPNTGNRTQESIITYKNTFDLAQQVIFPRFTKLPKTELIRLDEIELKNALDAYYSHIRVINNDDELLDYLVSQSKSGVDIFVFMGSHGFRGMINSAVELFQKNKL